MGLLVLVLVLVPPQGDVDLALLLHCLGQDPPAMSIKDHLLQVLQVQQVRQVPDRRRNAVLDAPQGDVEVSAGYGSIQRSTGTLRNRWQELVALGELPIMIQQEPDAMLCGVLDADTDGRPGPVISRLLEGLQDPMMNMLAIRCSSKAVQGTDQDLVGIELLRLCEHDHGRQGRLDSLGKLLELALVDVLACSRTLEDICGS